MATTLRIQMLTLSVLTIGLMSLAIGCEVTIINAQPNDGSGLANGDDSTTGNDGNTTSDEGNPNSPCTDKTNIYVSYVNKSSARVVFVENFRDSSNQVVSGSMMTLQAAGDADDTQDKCITCPAQAGIRNVRYVEDSVTTSVPFPTDLTQGDFICGDQITFVFQDGESVDVTVTTP